MLKFHYEPHEHHELLVHILSLFVLVRVVRGKLPFLIIQNDRRIFEN